MGRSLDWMLRRHEHDHIFIVVHIPHVVLGSFSSLGHANQKWLAIQNIQEVTPGQWRMWEPEIVPNQGLLSDEGVQWEGCCHLRLQHDILLEKS